MTDIYTSDDMRRALEITGPATWVSNEEYGHTAYLAVDDFGFWRERCQKCSADNHVPSALAHALINEHLRRWLAEREIHVEPMYIINGGTRRLYGWAYAQAGAAMRSVKHDTYEQALVAAVLAQGANP